MRDNVQAFLEHLEIERGLTEATIEAYRADLALFGEYVREQGVSLDQVDRHVVRGFLTELAENGNAVASRARRLATLKSFFRFLHEDGRLDHNPTSSLRLPKARHTEPSFLTRDESARLLDAVEQAATDRTRVRDVAIVSLFLGCGLRRSELINLNVSDVDLSAETVRVMRKGQREQTLPLSPWVRNAVEAYLEVRPEMDEQALFISGQGTRLSQSTLSWRLKSYFAAAGLDEKKACPNTLRHTFATSLMRNGVHLRTLMELMGHRSLSTTQKYLHISAPELREAAETIRF